MDVTVGTFNLNNLFTRWNFQAEVPVDTTLEETIVFGPDDEPRLRSFKGRVVKGKSPAATEAIARRILEMNVDVLAVQEVENIEALRTFNGSQLSKLYKHTALIEGNDPRLIDVAIMSKLPLGSIVSHQTAPDPADTSRRVFGRDLLQVNILNQTRKKKLFTVFNTHMKSNFVDTRTHRTPAAQAAAADAANQRRARQSAVTAKIIAAQTRPRSRYVFLGDMNDDPDSPHMAPVVASTELGMVDALIGVTETRPSKPETVGPQPGPRWTSRHKKSRQDPEHRLFDQIWVSPSLASKVANPMIDRRTKHGGDGSDHDPAWITLMGL